MLPVKYINFPKPYLVLLKHRNHVFEQVRIQVTPVHEQRFHGVARGRVITFRITNWQQNNDVITVNTLTSLLYKRTSMELLAFTRLTMTSSFVTHAQFCGELRSIRLQTKYWPEFLCKHVELALACWKENEKNCFVRHVRIKNDFTCLQRTYLECHVGSAVFIQVDVTYSLAVSKNRNALALAHDRADEIAGSAWNYEVYVVFHFQEVLDVLTSTDLYKVIARWNKTPLTRTRSVQVSSSLRQQANGNWKLDV